MKKERLIANTTNMSGPCPEYSIVTEETDDDHDDLLFVK